jgi:hypothetical protein
MAVKTRAERRHHRERLIRKFYRQHLDTTSGYGVTPEKHLEWAMKYARIRTTCRSVMDCGCCCHPRKTHGNSKAALTIQEQRLALRVNDTED